MIFTRFTNPEKGLDEIANTANWNLAYSQLNEIVKASTDSNDHSNPLNSIAKILLPNLKNTHLAWILCCFVPWARAVIHPPEKKTFKSISSAAAAAAREGIKADNEIRKVVEDAVSSLSDIDTTKNVVVDERSSTASNLKRKDTSMGREIQGKAIRRWGAQWRSSIMYALLIQISEAKDQAGMFKETHFWTTHMSISD